MDKTIVVGYDDKEPAKRALDRAVEEARTREAGIVVITVAEMPLTPDAPRNYGTLDDGPIALPSKEPPVEIEAIISRARERLRDEDVEVTFAWVAGEPGHAIVQTAKDERAELIVVGSHHKGFFGRIFSLSVPDEVKREAGCDVLVVD